MKKHLLFLWFFALIVLAAITMAVKTPPSFQPQATPLSDTADDPVQLPDEIITPSFVGEVYFPHETHVEDLELDCDECHHEINASALNIPHDEYFDDFWIDCEVCHRTSSTVDDLPMACDECHHHSPVSIADESLSAKVAIHENCWECHDIEEGEDASKNCSFCHSGPRTSFASE